MKRIMIVTAAAALLLGIAAVQVAEASCPLPRNFTTIEPGEPRVYIYTQGVPPTEPSPNPYGVYYPATVSVDHQGLFWSFSGGNPLPNLGNDSGTFDQTYWWFPGFGYVGGAIFPSYIGNYYGLNNWSSPGIDGCIDLDGSDPSGADPDQCMVALLQDQYEGVGYWALVAESSAAGDYFFNRASGGGPITLVPIPKPTITGSLRNGTAVDVTVSVSNPTGPANGAYLDCQPAQNAAIVQAYRVYSQVVPRGSPPPTDRDLAVGWALATGDIPIAESVTITQDCPSDSDIYLCSQLLLDSGYSVEYCSSNSTRVQCGPNVADPIDVKPELPNDKPGRPVIRPDAPRDRRR